MRRVGVFDRIRCERAINGGVAARVQVRTARESQPFCRITGGFWSRLGALGADYGRHPGA